MDLKELTVEDFLEKGVPDPSRLRRDQVSTGIAMFLLRDRLRDMAYRLAFFSSWRRFGLPILQDYVASRLLSVTSIAGKPDVGGRAVMVFARHNLRAVDWVLLESFLGRLYDKLVEQMRGDCEDDGARARLMEHLEVLRACAGYSFRGLRPGVESPGDLARFVLDFSFSPDHYPDPRDLS